MNRLLYIQKMTQSPEEALALLKRRLDKYDKYEDIAFADYVATVEFTQIKPDFLGPPNNVYMSREEREKQIAEWTAAIEKEPNNPHHLFMRGCSYISFSWTKGHPPDASDNAIADFTAALKIKPDNTRYLSFRASTYYEKKEYDKAIADYTTALKIKEEQKEQHERGLLYLYEDDYNNEVGEFLTKRGHVYHCKGDYDNAIADYNAAAVQDEDLIWRGLAYTCKKEYDKAIADWERVSTPGYYKEMVKALLQKIRKI